MQMSWGKDSGRIGVYEKVGWNECSSENFIEVSLQNI